MNILMVWELGAGLGHTIPLAAIGKHFVEKGHNVSYALRNPKTAEIAGISPDIVYSAPVMSLIEPNGPAAYDCADMLLIRGYGLPKRINNKLKEWANIFDKVSPDVIITDHAPTARLAAHIAGIPSHAIGNGFAIPPLSSPLQSFGPQSKAHAARQQQAERGLNNITNRLLRDRGVAEVERAVDLYFGGSTFLITFEELDNYSQRPVAKYHGVTPFLGSQTLPPVWPVGGTKNVFVYIYSDTPALPKILKSLVQLGVSALVYTGAQPRGAEIENLACEKVRFSDQPISLLGMKSDLAICQGGSGTMVPLLLQGIPLLTIPQHIEQSMVCTRLKSQGLAEILNRNSDQSEMTQTIKRCLDNEKLHQQATRFSDKYKNFDGQQVPKIIVDEVLKAM